MGYTYIKARCRGLTAQQADDEATEQVVSIIGSCSERLLRGREAGMDESSGEPK